MNVYIMFSHLMACEPFLTEIQYGVRGEVLYVITELRIHDSSESHLQQLLTKLNPLSSLTSLMSTVRNL